MKKISKFLFKRNFIIVILLAIVLGFIIKFEKSVDDTKQFTLVAAGFSPTHLGYQLNTEKKSKAFYKVAEKWSINFESKGCEITSDTHKYITNTNLINTLKLKRKYGFDWEKRFLKEVEEEISKMKN